MKLLHALGTAALMVSMLPGAAVAKQAAATAEPRFIHHVFFTLKRPGNAGDRARLIAALRKLMATPVIRTYQIGQHAGTTRDVVQRGYDVSLTLTFDSPADQETYQDHPIHLAFVRDNAALWSKVVVYDTVPVP
ncbi:Dabb family protein [Sphingomonas sp. Y38-1Y]|uniref:Dabb family protein n=1 Tax=Sphingomonas sp. Y38-1Y TaxID=3078265 RepID=UPI0028E1B065|nr:Dabb family protein [Sphingomonas sp. Y38-1Y]